jgi:hypothetical protein
VKRMYISPRHALKDLPFFYPVCSSANQPAPP